MSTIPGFVDLTRIIAAGVQPHQQVPAHIRADCIWSLTYSDTIVVTDTGPGGVQIHRRAVVVMATPGGSHWTEMPVTETMDVVTSRLAQARAELGLPALGVVVKPVHPVVP